MLLMKLVVFFVWLCIVSAKVRLGLRNLTGRADDYRIKIFSGVHIIDSYNYPVEVHTVVTRDGYILDIFRIPYSEKCKKRGKKPVVFLQHGLTCSADTFLMTGPKSGLPFMLVDACYDVWLSNSRGIRYSRRHTKMKSTGEVYWGFSWHEMGMEDLPAQFDYILSTTQQKALHFVGHSQGCTTLMVLLSMRPEYNKKMKTTTLLAPAVFMQNSRSGLINKMESVVMKMKDCDFFGHNDAMRFVITVLCGFASMKRYCSSFYLMANAKPTKFMNLSIIPLVLAMHPAAISSRQPKHFLQIKRTGKFQQFDFGAKKNQEIYKQPSPPEYPLKNVRPKAPIHIFYSVGDTMTVAEDVLNLISKLGKVVAHRIPFLEWGHMDFIFAKTVAKVINRPIMEVIGQYENYKNGK
ncbi:lipase 3-like [Drosophila subpulchrella]|uniref:lipase 3-like n=1 Tax=Drosophila subpulchrella TaxID=1486046 RepID=UPI0018A175F7|nr:lipase 3-like [Drosophila subpulchrella]